MSDQSIHIKEPFLMDTGKGKISRKTTKNDILLSLPNIHCAGCIGKIERALNAVPGVLDARVNLSRKRATISASAKVSAEDLICVLDGIGHEAQNLNMQMLAGSETDETGRKLLLRLVVAGFAMMNIMLFSVAIWSGASHATQNMFHWISGGIAVPALIYAAQHFFVSAWGALRRGQLNMDVPISLAIILAAGLSIFETTQGGHRVYFDAALSLSFFLLIGRYLDHRTKIKARSAAQELTALESVSAIRLSDGKRETVEVEDLAVDDIIEVLPGMRVPADGQIIKGHSQMDRALLTGESLPVAVSVGDKLAAGEVNLKGLLTLSVQAIGRDSALQRMAALVEMAEGTRNTYTALSDRAAQIYAPLVHVLALVTFIGWMVVSGEFSLSLNIAISVLIITCPCALGLAVPAVMTAATGRLFKQGFLVKNGTALERMAEIDTVIFDKTGTLTNGHAQIDLNAFREDAISVMAALVNASSHPVSCAIAASIPSGVKPAQVTDIQEVSGKGMTGKWKGVDVKLGQGAWLNAEHSPALKIGQDLPRVIAFKETLRDGAQSAVKALLEQGKSVQIFSGDNNQAVRNIAYQLGGVPAIAEMSPTDKFDAISALSENGARVLMVGDGLNDTAALAVAHASISPASALDAARTASDIVLLNPSLENLPSVLTVSISAKRRVLENFTIAAIYNLIAVPIAILGFATPLSAAIAMSASSITVLLNALRVR
ncbi:copper-translocating P-type ATPase [Rhodobacterales bacterium HTCC2150]|nr:copper-translocating P-type ATPase [Rhodobacterales bacterium HTCC2150] [Rhodobacteraceae bacterium HTCC2150]